MKKLITYTLLFLLPFAACKKNIKYSEDPRISFKKSKKRLEGTWNISEYTLNGVSIKDTLSKVTGIDVSLYTLGYYMEYDFYRLTIRGNWGGAYGGTYYGSDDFVDYHYIVLNAYSELFNKVFITPFKSVQNSTAKWEVTKLYGKDLHLQLVTDTGEYKIVFNKIKQL